MQNVNTGLSQTQVTNAAGIYNFPSLDPGTYRVEVTIP
ncbi:MAG: carboxypeptidase-like regulatory domain-containing protein, partial [Vicinamibacteria bacterium]